MEHIYKLNLSLGIDTEQQLAKGWQLFALETNCVNAGIDYYKRQARLHQKALTAWDNMHRAAQADGLELYICSAFRDYAYQANLIKKKLDKGIAISEILKILAPPGFSEHHTGRAIDIISSEKPELDESFEDTEAFAWLAKNAKRYNFSLSYPRGNALGVMYEPWHWCYLDSVK
ncbi:MAG: D-alanyl-D-alanine carboxypeptidase family protein [Gammaproteobacteria bacterium]|nr:D-alanyl-D-alanine carboxypeptidase family protein [Gammaproteobacteria bacterium]